MIVTNEDPPNAHQGKSKLADLAIAEATCFATPRDIFLNNFPDHTPGLFERGLHETLGGPLDE